MQDREGDIYESLCLLKANDVGFVIRGKHDRQIKTGAAGPERIREHFDNKLPDYAFEMEVKGGNSGRKKRTAQLSVQFETVELLKPKKIAGRTKKEHPASITVSIVRVKEKAESVPAEEKPIEWLLYSSEAVQNVKEALKVVEYYRARWIIEDFFRTLKSDGLKYEESELETGPALRKLFILALQAATVLLQLRQAREGTTMQKPSLVVSQDQMACLQDILPGLEGRTEKLKNPFPIDNLAWVTWIIARLGGWKGYKSQRPAGVITLRDGWVRFHHIYEGWVIAKDVYKH